MLWDIAAGITAGIVFFAIAFAFWALVFKPIR
jgi:hypothetical protein